MKKNSFWYSEFIGCEAAHNCCHHKCICWDVGSPKKQSVRMTIRNTEAVTQGCSESLSVESLASFSRNTKRAALLYFFWSFRVTSTWVFSKVYLRESKKISLYRLFCGTPRAVAGKHFWEIRYKSVKRNSFSYSEFIVLLKKPVNKLVIAYLRRFSEEFCSCFVVIINVLRTLWYANDIVLFLKIFNN